MRFITDEQTLSDLRLTDRRSRDSIFNLFNCTNTQGGAQLMELIFQQPLSKAIDIEYRANTIRFLELAGIDFPFKTGVLDALEQYITETDTRSGLSANDNTLVKKVSRWVSGDYKYKTIVTGLRALKQIAGQFRLFLQQFEISTLPSALKDIIGEIEILLDEPELNLLMAEGATSKLSFGKIAKLDELIRWRYREKVIEMLNGIYWLDIYITASKVCRSHDMVVPVVYEKDKPFLIIENFRYPRFSNAVPNSLRLDSDTNVIFLTGANMAGKSTLMKSLGIALYLAHLGFPVPASKMHFSAMDGLLTTINLSDDIGAGNSHFYAEVQRIKKIARNLANGKKIFIILDELFRGTNLADASEGTSLLTKAFADMDNCKAVISSHIIEAAEELQKRTKKIQFLYLPTTMTDGKPVYTYKLEKGISADRYGMIIIKNEGILDIIRNCVSKS